MAREPNVQTIQFEDGEVQLAGSVKLKCNETGKTVSRGREYVINMCRKRFNNKWQDLVNGFKLVGRGTDNSDTLRAWREAHPKTNTQHYSADKAAKQEELARTVVVAATETETEEELKKYFDDTVTALRSRLEEVALLREKAATNCLAKEEEGNLIVLQGQINSLTSILRTKFGKTNKQIQILTK